MPAGPTFTVPGRRPGIIGVVQVRYNFRVYPSPGQRESLARAFGCARVVFNDGLRLREAARAAGEPYIPDAELQRRVITEAKRTPEREWLADVSSVVLVQAVGDLHKAYRNWFDALSGRRKGRRVGHPRFRSKRGRQSIRLTRNGFSLRSDGKLYAAKVGDLDVRWSRQLPGVPSSVTLTLDPSGRHYASFVVDVEPAPLPETARECGIDLGLAHFATLDDGAKVDNPRFLRTAERRLARAQRALCRKKKGSANRAKARLRVATLHARVADTRRDWLHKTSTAIIRDNQAAYVEDLPVAGLARTRTAKSVHDAGWAMFVSMLEYKAARYGRAVVRVGRFFPSSQVCSACGVQDGPKPLAVRAWTCPACGVTHDRDANAAKNIKTEGRKVAAGRKPGAGTRREAETVNACGAQVRPAPMSAPRGEAGTHRGAA